MCMKCQILFSDYNKKNIINFSFADLAKRMIKIKWASAQQNLQYDLCNQWRLRSACLFYLGFTSLSIIFQSYHDSVWMWQGAQCSLLECCITEISHPRHLTWYSIQSHYTDTELTCSDSWGTVPVSDSWCWQRCCCHGDWYSSTCMFVQASLKVWLYRIKFISNKSKDNKIIVAIKSFKLG